VNFNKLLNIHDAVFNNVFISLNVHWPKTINSSKIQKHVSIKGRRFQIITRK